MPIFQVTKTETSSSSVFVEAKNKAQAQEIADQVDGPGWREHQDYEYKLSSHKAQVSELKGRYIETEKGSSHIQKLPSRK